MTRRRRLVRAAICLDGTRGWVTSEEEQPMVNVRGPAAGPVSRLLFRAAWRLVECVVRGGAALTGYRHVALGAERAGADRGRLNDEVATGLRSMGRFLLEAARR